MPNDSNQPLINGQLASQLEGFIAKGLSLADIKAALAAAAWTPDEIAAALVAHPYPEADSSLITYSDQTAPPTLQGTPDQINEELHQAQAPITPSPVVAPAIPALVYPTYTKHNSGMGIFVVIGLAVVSAISIMLIIKLVYSSSPASGSANTNGNITLSDCLKADGTITESSGQRLCKIGTVNLTVINQ